MMTPKERAAMQQALKAMEDASPYGLTFKEAIIACEEALEQPVSQESKSDCPCCGAKSSVLPIAFCRECESEFWPPQPVRTKDLTDDELQPFLDEWWNLPCDTAHDVKNIFRAVIAADREKNK